jgi:hypothetical protein
MKLPPGYTAMSLDDMLKAHEGTNFKALLIEHMGDLEVFTLSRARKLQAEGVIEFVVAPSGEPGLFIEPTGPDGVQPYASASDVAFAHRLVTFWDTQGKFNARTGYIEPEDVNPDPETCPS